MSPPLIILLTVLLAGLAVWIAAAWWRQVNRRRELVAAGQPLGLRFDAADPFDLPECCFELYLFSRGHSRLAGNVLHGRFAGCPARLFEYQYETGSGRSRRTHCWQVALIHTDLHWPGLLCQPRADYDPLEVVFGLAGVPFTVEPFAGQFHVAGESPDFAYQFLNSRLMDLLLAGIPNRDQPPPPPHPPEGRVSRLGAPGGLATLETHGEVVALYRPGRVAPAEAVALLELAGKVVASLPESMRQEMAIERQGS